MYIKSISIRSCKMAQRPNFAHPTPVIIHISICIYCTKYIFSIVLVYTAIVHFWFLFLLYVSQERRKNMCCHFSKKNQEFWNINPKKKKKKKKKPMFVVSLMCLYQSDVNPTQFVTLVSWGIYNIYIAQNKKSKSFETLTKIIIAVNGGSISQWYIIPRKFVKKLSTILLHLGVL